MGWSLTVSLGPWRGLKFCWPGKCAPTWSTFLPKRPQNCSSALATPSRCLNIENKCCTIKDLSLCKSIMLGTNDLGVGLWSDIGAVAFEICMRPMSCCPVCYRHAACPNRSNEIGLVEGGWAKRWMISLHTMSWLRQPFFPCAMSWRHAIAYLPLNSMSSNFQLWNVIKQRLVRIGLARL